MITGSKSQFCQSDLIMKKHILVVDDSPDDREVIERNLQNMNGCVFPILVAADGKSCLDHISSDKRIDCVTLDYSLPGVDGLAVLKKILEIDPMIAVVMVTGNGDEHIAVEAMKIGAQDYLPKDRINSDSLQRAITNATERASMQKKIQDQQDELTIFANVLVHDLRAPLQTLTSAIGMLTEDLAPEVAWEHKKMLDCIVQGAERMDRLILALKSYTEQNSVHPVFETVDLNEQVEAARLNLSSDLKAAGASLYCDGSLPAIMGSPPQVMQVIQNILGNSIKYNRSGAPVVNITSLVKGDIRQIRITDNGIGISGKYMKRIFEPFKRLHRDDEFTGTGLGLATCKKIMDRHGGKIWCQSKPEKGTTFILEFPSL